MAFGRFGVGAHLVFRMASAHLRKRRVLCLGERLAMLPVAGAPVSCQTSIYWDEHQIPFIEAETDQDCAVALGVVHAHLRLGQLELMRLIAKGRVAEMAGRFGFGIDSLVRTFDIGRAVPAMVAALPSQTRSWLEGFARGLNHCADNAIARPEECALLGIAAEPWTLEDIVLLGRLAAADVNWIIWMRLLKARGHPDWRELWKRLLRHDLLSFESGKEVSRIAAQAVARAALRSGSNSLAVARARTETGAALMANDPHLPIMLPNVWLLAGMKSPSHHAVGLMVPGIPFIGLGRNPHVAWGGASLHSASSDLVALPKDAALTERIERVAIRGEADAMLRIRESQWGPVVSDLPAFPSRGETLALRWIGHQPSDEFTAMLAASSARNWKEFRAAFREYAIPGLEMNYADETGHVGQLMAARLPPRRNPEPADIVSLPESGWETPIATADLPSRFDPPEGFVASANARPEDMSAIVGFYFSPSDRIQRLRKLLAVERMSVSKLIRFQNDVHLADAVRQRDVILSWLKEVGLDAHVQALHGALAAWDGNYDADSNGAMAFELLFFHLARALVAPAREALYDSAWCTRALIWADVLATPEQTRMQVLGRAGRRAARDFGKGKPWGARHRLRLSHSLGMIPVVGRRYRLPDFPASGTSETLMATAHGLTNKRHHARYGSVARHISDMSDPDANYFVLLGGQDGWFDSSAFADQVALWRRGDYATLPLKPETVRARFTRKTVLTP
jgi:penicillin G amidase